VEHERAAVSGVRPTIALFSPNVPSTASIPPDKARSDVGRKTMDAKRRIRLSQNIFWRHIEIIFNF
jgi:hypothetical protein